MPVYSFKCLGCDSRFDEILPIKDRNNPVICKQCGSGETERTISKVNFNLTGDNWPSKAYRIKDYGIKRREEMQRKMERRMRDQPLASLVPNVEGEVTNSWSDAAKLASSRGKDMSSYKSMVDKESKK